MFDQDGLGVQVLNVGDGACTIVRGQSDDRLTIIDCGTTTRAISGDPAASVQRLLGLSLANIDTMVVTHFDADHWHGLRDLAPLYRDAHADSEPVPAPKLIYAGMPRPARDLAPVIHSFQALGLGIEVRPLDLREAWKDVSVPLKTKMLFRGDSFDASGFHWDVLWPPRELPSSVASWIQKAINDAKRLADDMAREGDDSLQQNLDDAYGLWSDLEPSPGEYTTDSERDKFHSEELWEFPETEIRHVEDTINRESRARNNKTFGPYGKLAEPHAEAFRLRFAQISKKLSTANNFLSLVVAQERQFISFGDIKLSALTALLRLEHDARNGHPINHYCVALAPHHGSHSIPARVVALYPSVCMCISQSGPKLYPHRRKHFYTRMRKPRHVAGKHLYTHQVGTITVRPHGDLQGCQIAGHLGFPGRDFRGQGVYLP